METAFTIQDITAVFQFPENPPALLTTHEIGVYPQPPILASSLDLETETVTQDVSQSTKPASEVRGSGITNKRYTSSTNRVFQAEGVKNFNAFGLPQELLEGVYGAMQFDRPSVIQAQTLPLITQPPYASLVAQAHNGSGKTSCFVLCILSRINYELTAPQALLVVPTRELAIQNASVVKQMGKRTKVTVRSSGSNEHFYNKTTAIREMVVISTMGTLHTWRLQGVLPFQHIKVVVFDEADVMVDKSGFADHSLLMMMMVEREASKPQVLLFSATYSDGIRDLTEKLFAQLKREHVYKIYVSDFEISLDSIAQVNVKCRGYRDKLRIVSHRILPCCHHGKTIIFVRFRNSARNLHEILTNDGWTVTSISGEMELTDRDRVVREFRDAVTNVLIATDVLARGFDVVDVKVVINFDIPLVYETQNPDYETYLHRVGRSGRFKQNGVAFNFVDVARGDEEEKHMRDIAKHFDRQIPFLNVDSDGAIQSFLQKSGLGY